MNRRTFVTWLLLGYLALLLNVGPSAHHADFFGLHGSQCCGVNHDSNRSTTKSTTCGCCSHYADDRVVLDCEVPTGIRVAADLNYDEICGCALCEYFDCFNAIAYCFAFSVTDSHAIFGADASCCLADPTNVACNARGPPTA